jgi:ribosomal protein S18 acetylase RimI-like enzyme
VSKGAFDVVQADESHIDALVALFDAYRVFYGRPSNTPAVQAFVKDRLRLGDSVIFVASARGKADPPLGFTQLYPTYSSVSMKRLWILNDLYVDKSGRRTGVARALIDRARRLAIDTDAKGLILETAIDNRAAQALYESTGWAKDTEFYRYYLNV